jgi:hypothetical protein
VQLQLSANHHPRGSAMIQRSIFDEEFFDLPCFRLVAPIAASDLRELNSLPPPSACFADAKIAASDLTTARMLLDKGFRKICTQVELIHTLNEVHAGTMIAQFAEIKDSLHVSDDEIRAHASQFASSRFRQDPLLTTAVADALYAKWIRNSLSGTKRVACIGANFCTFADNGTSRWIDLLSVLDKQQGHARAILGTLLSDARRQKCACVRVVTEAENLCALATYRAVGFIIEKFINVFHFHVRGSG